MKSIRILTGVALLAFGIVTGVALPELAPNFGLSLKPGDVPADMPVANAAVRRGCKSELSLMKNGPKFPAPCANQRRPLTGA